MRDQSKLPEDDLIEAIKRSGYLLESEIANALARADFFVESNQVIEDPVTGKSRELDLIAEYFDRTDNQRIEHRVCAKIKFVFEIKNNIYPLVLITKFELSPNINIWESTKEVETIPKGIATSSTYVFYEKLLANNDPIYTQYCSFDTKKRKIKEIIATHPEQVYTGLLKITQYCEDAVESWEQFENDKYYRNFIYLPVLLIKDDLYELEIDTGHDPILHKVEESKLLFNYYYKNNPKMATIWVVTKSGFNTFIQKMIQVERNLEQEMIEVKKKQNKA